MRQTRILLVDMPRMLREIVREVAASAGDVEIIDQIGADLDLVAAVDAFEPDLVVMGADGPHDQVATTALERRARTRILVLTGDTRAAFLYELLPRQTAIGELSPATLVMLIRAIGEGGPDRDLDRE